MNPFYALPLSRLGGTLFIPALMAISLAMSASLAGCGNEQAAEPAPDAVDVPVAEQAVESDEVTASEERADAPDDVAEVHIAGDDAMSFDTDEFTLRPGQTVRLTLDHVGELPVEQMGHNVVILEAGEDPGDFGQAVAQEGGDLDNEYVPEALRDRVIAFTRMIGGGESESIEFTAPDEPGEYPFLCSFPGHYAVMKGVMVVEQ